MFNPKSASIENRVGMARILVQAPKVLDMLTILTASIVLLGFQCGEPFIEPEADKARRALCELAAEGAAELRESEVVIQQNQAIKQKRVTSYRVYVVKRGYLAVFDIAIGKTSPEIQLRRKQLSDADIVRLLTAFCNSENYYKQRLSEWNWDSASELIDIRVKTGGAYFSRTWADIVWTDYDSDDFFELEALFRDLCIGNWDRVERKPLRSLIICSRHVLMD